METTIIQATIITMMTTTFQVIIMDMKITSVYIHPEGVAQQQNVGLRENVPKTARLGCLGEELVSSQNVLEAEHQQTRMELSNLTERPKDNNSQNNLLEKKNSEAQGMEAQRERLNQSVSAARGELADATFDNIMESMNVTPLLHTRDLRFQSDDGNSQVVFPNAPPPTEFMDSSDYGAAKAGGQEQGLGSVPEEEESDWSELGDEIPRFILTGSVSGRTRRHQDVIRPHSPCPLPVPHLQFTLHSENLWDGMSSEGAYRITSSPTLGSAFLIRSASLEEISLARRHTQKELRGTAAMMDLHHQGFNAIENLDNEVIHHWRASSDRDAAIGRVMDSGASEAEGSLVSLQSAERMLNHFICEPQPDGAKDQGRPEALGWTGGIPDDVLKGERTKL
ncbi:uncharacterized protein si:dkey-273o13.3 [Brachionichthys hirsutus]|uniref:uncharacterized protein si:dkey-273o13.3 n=1 Tax=Brachionichthys hirsutus TaxID=412623 RepID=UPI003605376B